MGEVTVRLDDLPLRDDLKGMTPYGAPQAPLPVALNVNENTHPVPDDVIADIVGRVTEALRTVNHLSSIGGMIGGVLPFSRVSQWRRDMRRDVRRGRSAAPD